jgi:hypothetical protein
MSTGTRGTAMGSIAPEKYHDTRPIKEVHMSKDDIVVETGGDGLSRDVPREPASTVFGWPDEGDVAKPEEGAVAKPDEVATPVVEEINVTRSDDVVTEPAAKVAGRPKKATAKRSPAKKATAKRRTAKKTTAKRSPAKRRSAKKTTAKRR